MKESFLHLVWQQGLFEQTNLCTVQKENIQLYKKGVPNYLQGPDFSNAIVEIGGVKWAGNIEIHIKSSDWYAHKHQKDKNYGNVILHVVYEHDVDVYDIYGNEISTLELKPCISKDLVNNYKELLTHKPKWIFCEDIIKNYDSFKLNKWLERLYVERLERKVEEIEKIFTKQNSDWEATLFLMLSKYFGGNLNGSIFIQAFSQVDFSVIRKQINNKTTTPFLFGLTGLLSKDNIEDAYYQSLKKEFFYQKQKYKIEDLILPSLNFYGCRPQNFPTIRLAQLIAVYEKHQTLFAELLSTKTNIEDYKNIFKIELDLYWQEHYNFEKISKKSKKQLSSSFINLLLINVVVPILFLYHKTKGEDVFYLLDLMYGMAPEKNNIINKFYKLGVDTKSALHTQALLTLKKEYCSKERCAECSLGIDFIKNIK